METVSRLCAWFERQCVDEWYEDRGVKIDTMDNPGWSMKVDLKGTALQDKDFQEIRVERSDRDWFVARRNDQVFEAFGGSISLNEMIESFLAWAE
ncbi:rhodanese-related sulfurtransferase [Rhizobium leguminosarum]|uniref:immunity 53 family protein n=1 Tax=Rhizobium leguminosarum TaxID=384 RepID=UPI0006ACE1CC|nr:immunity 53 family protein [Rhizobium leguminosarum]MBY5311967.1 rhodanese-related sulfurtransferase [Rhizobium leguminosarum]NEH51190.1 rhodanese-related sulfurtransferase [Rhizobium leguminosarum]